MPRQTLKQSSSSSITRSNSVGVLNQSDSETDMTSSQRRIPNGLSSAMRPTISSQNKMNGSGKGGSSGNSSARRRSLTSTFSSGNLNNIGNEDSSSEEAGPVGTKGSSSTQQQQRPRSTSIDSNSANSSNLTGTGAGGMRHSGVSSRTAGGTSRPGGDLGRTAREVTQRLTQPSGAALGRRGSRKGGDGDAAPIPAPRGPHTTQAEREDKDVDAMLDIATAPLTMELCSSLVDRLTRSADAVVHLHKRISLLEGGSTPQHQQSPQLLHTLEEGVALAQDTLQLIREPRMPALHHLPLSVDGSAKQRDFPSLPMIPLPSSGQGIDQSNPAMMQMVQQYYDMLLSLFQQRMGNPPQKQNAESGVGQGSS
ncbi:hypothetical protein J437_LFUL009823 [Ladona fulva]|uniref:Uncharacterized protein n=1 Tax=Ladona fulva TaxID=123851 RepID=A0A8K0P245_LADFU|nr:hypothetical protein J437_LFUL009823 [Ladona fulva]